jgi:hypothetical protein
MNTSGYIRGPWVKRYNKFGDYEVIDSLGRDITIIEGYDNDAADDEASIISAAPEMLLILKNLLKTFEDASSEWNSFPDQDIFKIILKAEGKSDSPRDTVSKSPKTPQKRKSKKE